MSNEQPQNDQPAESSATDIPDTDADQPEHATAELVGERTDSAEPASHEARKYRTRLREVEAERDQLAATVDALRRAQIDQHIETMGVKAKAVWATGTQPADLLGEDGQPDRDKIKTAVAAARDELGIPAAKPKTTSGLHSTFRPQPARNTFVDAFKPARER